jgi:methylenetetrahydrofolate dehydrogenase (NAD+)
VYYPIFNNRQDQYLQQIVDVTKDVEGLSHRYIFNMYQNIRFLDDAQTQKSILPCTPLAVIKVLEYLHVYNPILPYGNRLFGHTICVVNRSEVVGRPLAALLANDGACVYSVDVTGVQQFTRGEGIRKRKHEVVEKEGWALEDCVPLCDVVVTGVPGEKFKFPCHLLREGAVCVNFSSEKVSRTGSDSFLPLPLNPDIKPDKGPPELRAGGQRKSFNLCPCYRQGDDRRAITQSLAHCAKPERKRPHF